MKIYDAILAAADSIECYPELFNFYRTRLPSRSCRTPGCALGWIALHAEYTEGHGTIAGVAHKLLGLDHSSDFYGRMNTITGSHEWKRDARSCARGLRLYAKTYHAPLPESVREIFTEENHDADQWSQCLDSRSRCTEARESASA